MKLKNISINKDTADLINDYLIDIAYQRLSLTDQDVLNEKNEDLQEILFGLKQLNEDLEYHRKKSITATKKDKDRESNVLREKVVESLLAGYWDWDIQKDTEYLSPRFKEMFGYKDHEMENKPESWQKIAFQEDLPNMFENFQKHADSKGEIPFNTVVRYHHKNGETVWVRCTGLIIEWDKNGAPKRAIGSHIDITEEKEKEIQLKDSLNEREVLLKEIHHRVKNNLHMVNSILEYQSLTIDEPEIKFIISGTQRRIMSMAAVHEKMYAGNNLSTIKVEDYFKDLIEELQNLYEKNIVVNFDLDIEPLMLRMDVLIPIAFIFNEIINNSFKHAFNGISNPNIKFSIKLVNKYIEMKIIDNGVGFSEKSKKSNSIGIDLINSFAEDLNADMDFNSSKEGVKYLIKIPSSVLNK